MILYLVRHGAAGSAEIDSERGLTEAGRNEVDMLLRQLRREGVRADRILHSGYRRARETAEILAPLGMTPPRGHPSLTPDDDPDILIAELSDLGGATLIVSHLPFLPHLCEQLLEDPTAVPSFGTATAVMLEAAIQPGLRSWSIAWRIDGRDASPD